MEVTIYPSECGDVVVEASGDRTNIAWLQFRVGTSKISVFTSVSNLQDFVNKLEAACVQLRGLITVVHSELPPEDLIPVLPETQEAIDDFTSDCEDDDIPF